MHHHRPIRIVQGAQLAMAAFQGDTAAGARLCGCRGRHCVWAQVGCHKRASKETGVLVQQKIKHSLVRSSGGKTMCRLARVKHHRHSSRLPGVQCAPHPRHPGVQGRPNHLWCRSAGLTGRGGLPSSPAGHRVGAMPELCCSACHQLGPAFDRLAQGLLPAPSAPSSYLQAPLWTITGWMKATAMT